MFPDLIGWLLYRVESGDTLTGIVRKARDFGRTTVAQIVAANDQIEDPDLIQVGWGCGSRSADQHGSRQPEDELQHEVDQRRHDAGRREGQDPGRRGSSAPPPSARRRSASWTPRP